jgi:uncharacterized protein
MSGSPYLELLDWRRRVSELFAELRKLPSTAETLRWFRAEKDALFRNHPQSPLLREERANFVGLPYWPFDPGARVLAHFTPVVEAESAPTIARDPSEVAFNRIGDLSFELHGQPLTLGAFWIEGYAGGLFVPFRDGTSGRETYGAGRYLLDTIKSADLGSSLATDTVVLDFNYAYHPSCAYDPRWVCPLAPPSNRLSIRIEAGEQLRSYKA